MRRRDWIGLKRKAVLGARWGLVGLAVLALRLGWGVEASWRLGRARAELRGQGIPVLPEDLPDPGKIPAEQDAVAPFLRALAALKLEPADREVIDPESLKFRRDVSTLTAAQVEGLRRIWREKKAVVADLDLAATRRQYGWSRDFREFFYDSPKLVSLGDTRAIANLYADMALLALDDHQPAEALHDVRRMLAMARILDKYPTLISQLVAVAIRAIAADVGERVLFSISWEGEDVAREARPLLEELLAAGARTSLEASWKGEFVFSALVMRRPLPMSPDDRPAAEPSWWLAPLRDDDEADVLRRMLRQKPVASATSYPAAKALVPAALPTHTLRLPQLIHAWSDEDYDMWDRVSLLSCRGAAEVRACTVLLAAQMHRQAHGQWPAKAEELVPGLLPAVPVDPFDAKGGVMQYRLDAGGPTAWSVGENGTDEGALLDAAKGYARVRNHPDIVMGAAWRELLRTMPP